MEKPILNGLIRDDPKTPEGKYLVKRRDGSIVEWPHFVIGARDPAAAAALRAYADEGRRLGFSPGYCDAVLKRAAEFEVYRLDHGDGDPDRGIHRVDDPETLALMRQGNSS